MGIDEREVYAVLGLDAPAEKPEAAEPAAQTGANESALAEPTGAGAQEKQRSTEGGERTTGDGTPPALRATSPIAASGDKGGLTGDGGTPHPSAAQTPSPQGEGSGGEMSKEERARQAAARREREKQDAIQAAVAAEREKLNREHAAELKEVFEKAGMTDRYNGGKPITSLEEFRAWDSKAQAAGLSRRLQEGKLTAEDLQKAIDSTPAMQAVKAQAERLQAAEAQAKQQSYQAMVDRELEEIRQLDPSVTSLADIVNREGGEEFSRLVSRNGLSFVEAFKLSNGNRLAKAQAMAAAEGAARQQHGKDHMRSVVGSGAHIQDVPRETVDWYRQLDPGMTMEDIRKDYFKRMPGKK